MKIKIVTYALFGIGVASITVPAFALEAWNAQQGGAKYQVIYAGKVYQNAWWVSSANCPGNAKANDAMNPWRYIRMATAKEISQSGNTLSCNKDNQTPTTPAKPVTPVQPTAAPTPTPTKSNVVAWNKQQGGNSWHVIFNGSVYKNAWWVASSNCPGEAKGNDATNPWRYVRVATAAEIQAAGNPVSCKSPQPATPITPVTPVTPATPATPVTPTTPATPATPATSVAVAWNGQEGSETYHVVFNGNVYKNAWWVGSKDCPLSATAGNDNNPWRFVRAATANEISQSGNPKSCDIAGAGKKETYPAWKIDGVYAANDKVQYNEVTYITSRAQSEWGFAPGSANPWKKYESAKPWSAGKVYLKGDHAVINGQMYEALFWTQNDSPALVSNQNSTGTNSRPWKPLGPVVDFSSKQLEQAPQFSATAVYEKGSLVRFNGENFVAQAKVKKLSPLDTNPWRAFVDWTGVKERVGTPQKDWPKHVYAPYVDFTLNSIPDFAQLAKNNKITHFTLAFIVSKNAETCLPTWGTSYGMNDYGQYSKIKALREAGGDVMISIGGANNAPLAASCKNTDELMQHYYDIVDNLNLKVLDFDIEGTWVADKASIERRNIAVKKVQDKWKSEGKDVGIWYTLPILPTGLTPDGMMVLQDAKAKGVELAGVNVMTMDYSNAICQSAGTEGQNIHGKCATSAIASLHAQLKELYVNKSDAQIDAMMGTTPMVGVNDVQGEVFYMSDARHVMQDAQKRNLGMVSIWSIARDVPGGTNLSPEFHGLTSQQAAKYAFSSIFVPFTKQ
jgi:bifunctional chitinase/lysozyme